MNTALRSWLLTVAISAGLQVFVDAEEPPETSRIPAFVGKLADGDPQVRADAASELKRFGPEAKSAVPALLALLTDDGSFTTKFTGGTAFKVHTAAFNALTAIGSESVVGLTAALGTPSLEVRWRAARILGLIGPKAKPALPALMKAATDTDFDIRGEVAKALPRIDDLGDQSVPLLLEWLQVDEIHVRKDAATALGAYRGHFEKSVPFLLKMLKDKDPSARGCAAQSLGKLAKSPRVVVPALTALLSDGDRYEDWYVSAMCAYSQQRSVHGDAAQALREFGEEAQTIGSALVEALPADQRAKFPLGFAIAIGEYGPESKPFVLKLAERLGRPELGVRRIRSSLTILNRLGPHAAASVPAVRKLFNEPQHEDDPDGEVQIAAACALVSMDFAGNREAWERVLAEIDEIQSEDPLSRMETNLKAETILETLGRLGPTARTAVPKLVELWERIREHLSDDRQIVVTLGQIGPAANAAAPLLVRQLSWSDDDEKPTRTALVRIGRDAIPALLKGLDTFADEQDHCVRILEVIGQFGGKADSAVSGVIPFCRDERRDVRAAAAKALGQIRAAPEIVVPELMRLLKDDRPVVREQAALSLAAFKAAASPAVTALATALNDEYIDVRTASAEGLGSIGPLAKQAIRALEQATKDSSPLVRGAAKTALAKLDSR